MLGSVTNLSTISLCLTKLSSQKPLQERHQSHKVFFNLPVFDVYSIVTLVIQDLIFTGVLGNCFTYIFFFFRFTAHRCLGFLLLYLYNITM